MTSSSVAPVYRPTRVGAFVNATLAETGRAVATPRRVALVVLMVALGAAAGVAISLEGRPEDRTFAAIQGTTQLVISVLLPLSGILLGADLRRRGGPILPTAFAATAVAVRVAVVGLLAAVLATSAAAGTTEGRWNGAASLVVGGLLVQIGCVLNGVGLGLLVRRVWLAFLASFLPLGVYAALAALPTARDWLTPYASAQHVLSGATTPLMWVQALVVLLLWSVCIPAWGASRLQP